ncbi:MAG: hypothetical protein ABR926_07765 [Streptosporangiaceae bacterium]|jgi:hypothetical protein
MRFQAMGIVPAAVAAGLALAACSAASPGSSAGPSAPARSPAPGAHAAAPVEPATVAAVRADADDYLTLYTAGQFAIIYQMLSANARQAINEQAWVAVHRGCPGATGGMIYKIRRVAITGKTAMVTVALTGEAAKPESATETLVYADGHWGFSPGDLGLYRHGSVSADVAAAKAAGGCAS